MSGGLIWASSNVGVRTIGGGPGVPAPEICDNAIYVSAQFKDQRHKFRLYGRISVEDLLLVDA